MKPSALLRHCAAVVMLWVAWKHLQDWYLYRSISDFQVYIALFCGALVISALDFLLIHRKAVPFRRLLILFPVLLLLLVPWGEIFRLNYPNTREDWARQIYFNGLFLYAALFLIDLAPAAPVAISYRLQKLLTGAPYRRLYICIPIVFAVFTATICIFVYHNLPVVNDTSAYLFQAKIFKEGKLFAPVPPKPEFFSYEYDMLVMKNGRWFSMYPPGFPLLLAVAMFLKAQWLLNPLLGAITIAIWMKYAARWHDQQTAILLAVLLFLSPFTFKMFSTALVHAPELFVASAVIYLCRRELEDAQSYRKLLLFLSLVLAVLLRFFSLMVFLAPVFVYVCWLGVTRRSVRLTSVIVTGIFVGVGLLALYDWKLTGNPLVQPYSLEYPDLHYGFGKNFAGLTHSPARAIEQLSNSLLSLNRWLNGWYSGSFVFILAAFLFLRRFQKWDVILLCSCISLLTFYFFYIAQDIIFGPRFIFLLGPVFLLFIARVCCSKLENPSDAVRARISTLLLISLLTFFPLNFWNFIRMYKPVYDPAIYFAQLRHSANARMIVFLAPEIPQDYINWNDPFLRDPVLFCRDLGPQNARLETEYPDRKPIYFGYNKLDFRTGDVEAYAWLNSKKTADHSQFNFFELTSAIQYASKVPDLDIFDVTYPRLLHSYPARPQLEHLPNTDRADPSVNEQERNFRTGLVHTARILLLPRLAYEEGRFSEWSHFMDWGVFRSELSEAEKSFARAGSLGELMKNELYKVRRRIDANGDSVLSDGECQRYLSEKILLFATFV